MAAVPRWLRRPHEAWAACISRNAARMLRQTLMRVLARAKKQGEIRPDADLDSMGGLL